MASSGPQAFLGGVTIAGCLECGRGLHQECKRCRKGRCHPAPESSKDKVLRGVGRPVAEPHTHKDPLSTGRKRAAYLYPIFKDEPCEWQGKKNCGGGKYPITGCTDGLQRDRHHGPIKDTRHNESDNVHRICSTCHHRWHALNDAEYDEKEYKDLLHKPDVATETELLTARMWWQDKGRGLKSSAKGED